MQPPASAVIDIGSHFAWVRPADLAQLVLPALCYTSTSFAPHASGGYRKECRQYQCYQQQDNGALRILVGHVKRVKEILENAGLTVTVQGHREFGIKAAPSLETIERAWNEDREFLEIVAREPRGLIEVRRQFDVVRLSTWICKLFPAARIFLPVATRRQISKLRRELQGFLGLPVHVFEDYPWPWEGGRLVCTLQTFDVHNPDDLEVVICPNAAEAVVSSHSDAFASLPGQRVYGFLHAGSQLSAQSRLRLEGVFGPVVYAVPDPRGREAKVCLHWCVPPDLHPNRDLNALHRKRSLLWHNERRNDLIAAVATAFRTNNREQLWRHSLLLAEKDSAFLAAGRPSVAILVESVEHGRALGRRLDGWRLSNAVPRPSERDEQPFDVESLWDSGILDRVILTLAQASRLGSVYTDVLIIASGQGWPDGLRGFPPRLPHRVHRVLLVDFADDSDTDAKQTTVSRQRAYTARGWEAVTMPAWMRQMD